MSIRLQLTLDNLRIVRLLLDESTGRHTAYSIGRRLGLQHQSVRFALENMRGKGMVDRHPQYDKQGRVLYALTPQGESRVITALESIGATIAPPRIFLGVPPPPRRQAGIFAAST